MRDPLAAIVEKPDAESAIESLRAEGVYDDNRKVRERDDGTVELPITDAPERTAVLDVIRQVDPDLRSPELADLLRERGWSDDEIENAPKSWAVVGRVVLVRFPEECPRPAEVGEAILDLHGEADTVLAREGIDGPHREPDVSVVAGSGDTETIHTEHGTKYGLDLAEVMFSPGNQAERVRMGEVVGPDERVFDMFAGIGYFTLPMARAGATITAVERNPTSFQFLLENAVLNGVTDRVEAYRADCRDIETEADRVVMGHYDAHEYLDHAMDSLVEGGILHYHETTPENRLWDRPEERLVEAASVQGREVELLDRRQVKSYGEGVWHVVLDARVT